MCQRAGAERGLRRRELRGREKRGAQIGPTKSGKGTKRLLVTDGHGTPLAFVVRSASPAEIRLVEEVLEELPPHLYPELLIGDRAYDSDAHDVRIREKFGIELVSPHRRGRKRKPTQDGRHLRRYVRRWKVERTFAWLANSRRLVNRWERNPHVYEGFLSLACILITLRRF